MPDFKAHGYGYVESAKGCFSSTLNSAIVPFAFDRVFKMPPRLNLFTARAAVFRPASSNQPISRRGITSLLNANGSSAASASANGLKSCLLSSARTQTRYSSSESKGKDNAAEEVPREPLPHVSEEAAEVANIMNKKCDGSVAASPELEQGTPISEVGFLLMSFFLFCFLVPSSRVFQFDILRLGRPANRSHH